MGFTCRSRVFISTCLLIWSFSSLLITNKLMKTGKDKEETNIKETMEIVEEPRRIVRGHYDFHGELIAVPDIDEEGADIFDPKPTNLNMEVGVGRHDRSHEFLIYDSVVVGPKFSSLSSSLGVTLTTQTSVDRLHWLPLVSAAWSGPVSVAVFVPDKEFDICQAYISYLRSCYQPIRDNVLFSLVHPVQRPPRSARIDTTTWLQPCHHPEDVLKSLTRQVFTREYAAWRTGYNYPQNHLRNIARQNSITYYTMSLDVDIIPSPGMAKHLSMFLNSNTCSKCAFVVPTYEIHDKAELPANKSELLHLIKMLRAQPFHSKVFLHNQFATNFSQYVISYFFHVI